MIMVVDDDPAILSGVALLLEQAEYQVLTCIDGQAFEQTWRTAATPELIILDLMLPDTDGYAICRQIRAAQHYIPILMISAKEEAAARIEALNLGADDFIVKPFVPGELIARVRAILRLAQQHVVPTLLQYHELSYEPATGSATINNQTLELTSTEAALLYALMSKPEATWGREMLLKHVWGIDYLGNSRMVDVCVQRLRTKLGVWSTASYIQTVHGFGYRLRYEQ